MKRIGFWFAKAFAYLIAITPFSLLYLRSDFYYFLVYHLVGYRKKVVRDNLAKSFPEKSKEEIKQIEKQFYHNLCDVFVETCKLLRVKSEELSQHVTFTNPELLQDLYERRKNVFTALPHSGNWEWYGKLMHLASAHKATAIYKKLSNPYFDAFMLKLRKNYDLDQEDMLESSVALRALVRRKDLMNSVLILADQSPRGLESDYWAEFLHRDTCWFFGLERMAKLLDYAVVFVEMVRTGRGRYQVTFKMITDDPKSTPEGFIMEQYVRHIERFIQNNPDNWLWSHRRWKRSRQPLHQ